MAVAVRKEHPGLRFCRLRHGHGLRRCGPFIQQGGIGHVHSGEIDHHALEVQQGLQPPLRDFSLVGRVGGVPAGILQDVALNYSRCDGPVITLPDKRLAQHIPRHDLT